MSVQEFIKHNYRHFNAAVVVDASEAYMAHSGARRKNVSGHGRRDEHRGTRTFPRGNDPAGQSSRHLHDRRESRRRYFQSRRPQSLPARPQLPQSDRRRRTGPARARHEPRHRHLHSRRRSHAPHRAPGAEVLAAGRQGKTALFPVRIHVPAHSQLQHSRNSTRSIRRTPGSSPRAKRICRSSRPAGKIRRWEIFLSPTACAATFPISKW